MTAKQQQCLLGYLGYYTGQMDGQWGSMSTAACRAFQADYGLEPDGICGTMTQKMLIGAIAGTASKVERPAEAEQEATDKPKTGTWWGDIKYFKPEEDNICCPCPRCVGKKEYPTEALMKTADSIRQELGPMVVSSCRRCQEHNDELSGSAKNSRHIIGKAMDFNAPKSTPAQIEACLSRRKAAGEIRYWYRMSSGWYHFDIE